MEALTVDDVSCIFEYWLDHPPVNELAAAYLGLKPRKRRESTLGELAAALGGTRG